MCMFYAPLAQLVEHLTLNQGVPLPAWLHGFSFLTLMFLKVPVDFKSTGTFFIKPTRFLRVGLILYAFKR